jgi:flagellar M-ring protein FliF
MAAGAQLDKTSSNPGAAGPGALIVGEGSGSGSGNGPGNGSRSGLPAGIRDLAGPLGEYWDKGAARWELLPPRQRSWAMIGIALLAATVAGLVWYGTRTDWRTLYAGLDPEDTRQMAQVLTQAQISFDLAANGTTIRVPAAQLDKARLATAAKGGPRSGRMGFELFDKPNWVGSEFDEQVNYQRALEGELEHTVATLADVQSARVHLVMPHDSLFRDQERPAKAAVVLMLRHRSLADGEDEAIRNLVASAVDGLSPIQVTLIDASGHLPLGPKTGEAMRMGMEEALEAKVIETLEPVTGPGNVRASVTVDYDPTSTDVTEETYDPAKVVTLTMQRTEQTASAQPIPAGVPGTASNAPNSQALPVYPQQVTPPQSAKSESGTYGASRTVRHVTAAPGHIRRLTAAVVVNDRIDSAGQKGKAVNWQPRTAVELRTLTALAQAAVGFDSGRGDLVTVQDLAFDENRNVAPSLFSQVMDMVERSPVLIKYCTLLMGLVLLILLVIRPALGRAKAPESVLAKSKPAALAAPAEAQAVLATTEQAAIELEKQRVQRVFDQVTETLKRDPAQSSRLLQSWIHSD